MTNPYLTDEDIEQLRKILKLPNLEIFLRSTWGSQNSNHRQEIHGFLKEKMAAPHELLSTCSISHCSGLGGFVFSTYDSNHVVQLGFDIEENSRVTDEIARRVCKSSDEFSKAPSAASLWTAKEAAFKALKGPEQPAVVSDIELDGWQTLNSHIETVRIKNGQKKISSQISGTLIKKKPYTFAIFASLS